jgi:hypothetical protein
MQPDKNIAVCNTRDWIDRLHVMYVSLQCLYKVSAKLHYYNFLVKVFTV